jgi:protein-S-isoprenylcysteine O-methyltransferase Ste14
LNHQSSNRQISPGNPIANVIVVIVGMLTIGAFIVLGVVAAVALGGVVLVLAAILGIRMWWLGRKMPKQHRTPSGQQHSSPADNSVIEGEFQVVATDRDENRPD